MVEPSMVFLTALPCNVLPNTGSGRVVGDHVIFAKTLSSIGDVILQFTYVVLQVLGISFWQSIGVVLPVLYRAGVVFALYGCSSENTRDVVLKILYMVLHSLLATKTKLKSLGHGII